jgi:aspartate/glutamate racemase
MKKIGIIGGIGPESTRNELLSIATKMIDRHFIDALILGCTELPLILNKDEFGIPFLNTTAIHAESIVSYCIGKETYQCSPSRQIVAAAARTGALL